jgi:hypothetical protein
MRMLHHLTKSLLMLALLAQLAVAGERPTFNKDTCDPRPDILPYWLHDWHQDYRSVYNRPRYWPGRIAHTIEPTSQEAMVWCEANQMGLYNGRNCPPAFKQYYYPKPWEILQTGPRPDFAKPNQLEAATSANTERSPSDQSSRQPQQDSSSSGEKVTGSEPAKDTTEKSTSVVKPARAFHFKGM